MVGFAAEALTRAPSWANESLGVGATEVMRQLNERLGDALNQAQRRRINAVLVPALARAESSVRFGLPADQFGWVAEHAKVTIKQVRDGGYDIVGDLDELRVAAERDMRRPDDASDAEMLDAALEGLALLTEQHARLWWQHRRDSIEAQPHASLVTWPAEDADCRSTCKPRPPAWPIATRWPPRPSTRCVRVRDRRGTG